MRIFTFSFFIELESTDFWYNEVKKGGAVMTKQEVLYGALALNGSDKKYTVTIQRSDYKARG